MTTLMSHVWICWACLGASLAGTVEGFGDHLHPLPLWNHPVDVQKPPSLSPFTYDPIESRKFASLSSVTYCDDVQSVIDWTCTACNDSQTRLVPGQIKVVDGGYVNATRIIIGKMQDNDGCLVAFRGSDDLVNWIRNFQFWQITPITFEDCDGCMVHSGFYTIWKNMKQLTLDTLHEVGCVSAGKDNLLYITGHSMGGSLANLATFTLTKAGYQVAKTYSFEAPRVGNKAFSDEFSRRFVHKFPVFRITNHMDPVIHLPPRFIGYEHVQKEVYYDASGNYTVCDAVESKICADQYSNMVDLLFHVGDHCASPLLPNGDFCNPVGCFGKPSDIMI